jgi:hypothetical protein
MANNCTNTSPYSFCGDTHCNSQEVYDTSKATCEANGWGRDVKIVSRKADGSCCYCWCSCAAYGTLVLTGENRPLAKVFCGIVRSLAIFDKRERY